MSGLMTRIKQFTRSPRSHRTIVAARRAAADPRRRAQARRVLSRLRARR